MKTSVIIPTYRRTSSVVENTISSIFADQESVLSVERIILIDQNNPPLEFNDEVKRFGYLSVTSLDEVSNTDAKLIHIHGLSPSVTKAKNIGSKWIKGEYTVFFDDDVTVQPGCISNYIKIFDQQQAVGFLGGREILDHSFKKESLFKSLLRKLAQWKSEPEYQVDGVYVGRIKSNSFMIKNFNVETDHLVKIDGARGCNWACRSKHFFASGGFDEYFQGTALREETDLYLRLRSLGADGYYTSKSAVIHHRQLGGCDNLSQSMKSLKSKFENERYFQRKHFPNVTKIFFAIRTLPLVVETLKESRFLSVFYWLKYTLSL